jgi:hypothetical protein
MRRASLTAAVLLIASSSHAQWRADGIALCEEAGDQTALAAVPDGAGGAIVVWEDHRTGGRDIYAQRIGPGGVPLWAAGGVPLCTQVLFQEAPMIVTDGAGGAIAAWRDFRNSNWDLYAQRVDALGSTSWTANGVQLTATALHDNEPAMTEDDMGGAIVVFLGSGGIVGQRVDPTGSVLWGAQGTLLHGSSSPVVSPALAPDGLGGAFVTWTDTLGAGPMGTSIYARRVNSNAVALWGPVAVCVGQWQAYNSRPVRGASNDAIVVWEDQRSGGLTATDIYAQRLDASGTAQWTSNGVLVCATNFSAQTQPAVVPDGSGGAYVAWQDTRSLIQSSVDVYAQRVNVHGQLMWPPSGVAVSTAPGFQVEVALSAVPSGGCVVSWEDGQSGSKDVIARALDGTGATRWQTEALVCSAFGDQTRVAVVSDDDDAIVAWEDARTGHRDVYAQRVNLAYGDWGHPAPVIVSVTDNPSDDGGKVIVRWTASLRDAVEGEGISHYSVWRSMDQQAWQRLADQPASYQTGYSALVPTTADGPVTNYFQVIAHESVLPGARAWKSQAVSAVSQDNAQASAALRVQQNRPNPFTDRSEVELELADAGSVRVDVYDVTGKTVRTYEVRAPAGRHIVALDGRDSAAQRLPAGVYFYRVSAAGEAYTRKMVIVR